MSALSLRDELPDGFFDPIFSATEVADMLALGGHALWVIEGEDGAVCAHLLVRVMEGAMADILSLYVVPELRRRGYALRLMAALVPYAHAEGCVGIAMEVRASNDAARALYGACGFEKVSIRKAYYTEPAEDAVVLALDLPS